MVGHGKFNILRIIFYKMETNFWIHFGTRCGIIKGNTKSVLILSIIHNQSVSDGSESSKEMKILLVF